MPLMIKVNLALMVTMLGLVPILAAAGQGLDAQKRGEALVQRWCVSCHLPGPATQGSDAAPTLHQLRAMTRKDADHIGTFLSHPHTPMPPLPLSRGDIADIVTYLGSGE